MEKDRFEYSAIKALVATAGEEILRLTIELDQHKAVLVQAEAALARWYKIRRHLDEVLTLLYNYKRGKENDPPAFEGTPGRLPHPHGDVPMLMAMHPGNVRLEAILADQLIKNRATCPCVYCGASAENDCLSTCVRVR